MAWPRPLAITDTSRAVPLLRTSDRAGLRALGTPVTPFVELETSPDSLSSQILATVSRDSPTRLVVIGDVSFLEPMMVQNNPQNIAFGSNVVDWLAREETLIDIRSKDRTPPRLALDGEVERILLKWLNLAGIPLLLVTLGAIRIVRRRRRAGRGWEGEEAE